MKTKFAWWPVRVHEFRKGCWFESAGWVWLERVRVIDTTIGDKIYAMIDK